MKKFHPAVTAFLSLTIILPALLRPAEALEYIVLPAALTEIAEEAFAGDVSITAMSLPEGLTAVGNRCFAGCAALNAVTVPDSVEWIGVDAFSGCGEALLIRCGPGSAAYAYAEENQIDFQADTTYRALVIGQTYTGTQKPLNGPANDLRAVRFCLQNMGYAVTAQSNLSADGILSAIASTFSAAAATDVSLFYYSGHGEEDGSLVGGDGVSLVSPSQLKSALDQISGRKVVLVDACYSGSLISEDTSDRLFSTRDAATSDGAAQFLSAFQSVFSHNAPLRGALNTGSYFVITAARDDEKCEEGWITSGGSTRSMGYFTYSLCLGLGYDGVVYRNVAFSADANADGAVSIQEAYAYASSQALSLNSGQHASVWPSGCRWFAPFRP